MFPQADNADAAHGVPAFWSWIGRHAHPVVVNGLSPTPSNDAMERAQFLMRHILGLGPAIKSRCRILIPNSLGTIRYLFEDAIGRVGVQDLVTERLRYP